MQQKEISKPLMTNRPKFRVEVIGHACYFAVGTWLATLWAPSVQKWSLYENGGKFWESWKKGERKSSGQVQKKASS